MSSDQLVVYADLVREYAGRLDLVAPGDLARFEDRHVDDSLRLAPLIDELGSGPCVDVGSGAGLPGIPLAIARPERSWTLLEPRAKRAGFLDEVVRRLDLDVRVLRLTAQDAAARPDLAGAHALATARALAVPARAARLLAPLLAAGGIGAVFVGRGAAIPPDSEVWRPGIAIIGATR